MPGGEEAARRPSSRLGTFYLLPSAVQIAGDVKKGWTVPEPTGSYSYNPGSRQS